MIIQAGSTVFHHVALSSFQVIYPLQATGIALIVLLNLFMLRSFNAALQSSPTSLQASLLTTAANLVITVRTVVQCVLRLLIFGVYRTNGLPVNLPVNIFLPEQTGKKDLVSKESLGY